MQSMKRKGQTVVTPVSCSGRLVQVLAQRKGNLMQVFRGFPWSFQENIWIVPQIRPCLLPYTFSTIYYSLVILSFGAVQQTRPNCSPRAAYGPFDWLLWLAQKYQPFRFFTNGLNITKSAARKTGRPIHVCVQLPNFCKLAYVAHVQ
jgi:hypothetical protein